MQVLADCTIFLYVPQGNMFMSWINDKHPTKANWHWILMEYLPLKYLTCIFHKGQFMNIWILFLLKKCIVLLLFFSYHYIFFSCCYYLCWLHGPVLCWVPNYCCVFTKKEHLVNIFVEKFHEKRNQQWIDPTNKYCWCSQSMILLVNCAISLLSSWKHISDLHCWTGWHVLLL